jgi:hypothetical protein
VVVPKNPFPARLMVDTAGAAASVLGIDLLENADMSLVIL